MKVQSAIVVVMLCFMPVSLFAQYGDTVKIMTYNINYESNKNTQYDGIIAAIKEINPTIAGLQKLDSCMGTVSNPCYVPKLIGDQTNMFYEFVTGDPQSYGNGFLSKQAPKSVRKIKLSGTATIPRAALEIGVTVGGEPVRVIVTHMDLSAANRTAEMKQIIAWMDSGGAKTIPAVIMADFNAGPTEDCMTQLTSVGFVFLKTSTGAILDTAQKINHILYRPENRWKIVDIGNPKYAASNRYPLWGLMSLLNPVSVNPPALEGVKSKAARARVSCNGKTMVLNLTARSMVSVRLLDCLGKLVATVQKPQMLSVGGHEASLSDGSLKNGIYFLECTINKETVSQPITVMR